MGPARVGSFYSYRGYSTLRRVGSIVEADPRRNAPAGAPSAVSGCLLALLASLVVGCAAVTVPAGDDAPERSVGPSQASSSPDEPETVEEAVEDVVAHSGRIIGGPADVEVDLATAFPKPDSILPGAIPKGWFDWKRKVLEEYGVALAVGYQMGYQHISESRTGTHHGLQSWLQIEAGWTALNRDEDFEGSLIVSFDWRTNLSGSPLTALGPVDAGSLWPTDVGFLDLGPSFPIFYWEQWFTKDRFVLRVGKQIAAQAYDFFRFKDGRTAFSGGLFTQHPSIPSPPFGQAVSFKWWPIDGSPLYVFGTLNDMNGDPDRVGFDTFFELHQFFYGVEIGYFWKRGQTDFDHVHLDIFYADERTARTGPGSPNEAGGGFKLLGSKQWGQVVGFGSYTYNTAEGGGFGFTFARHTATAGVAYLKPVGVRGEIGFGATWADPINGDLRDQYGGELYWKMLLTPDLWITPGMQVIVNPSFNPDVDTIFVAQFKFRLFF